MNGNGRRTLDVSALASHGFGLRSVLVWGSLLAIAIEGTMMALALVSFVYVRGNYQVWPPSGVGPVAFRLAAVQMGLLLASLAPTILLNRAAVRERFAPTRRWLLVATLFSVAISVVRGFELPQIQFRWDQNAFGSAFWLVLGIHVTHILSGVVDFAMTAALMYGARQRFEKKHYVDVESAGILWYFVVIEWVIAYPVIYLLPLGAGR